MMEKNHELIESLLESVTVYLKTNLELLKYNALDKASEGVSSLIPYAVVWVLVATFVFFLNVGVALLVGDLLGNTYYGLFAVGGFYGLAGLIVRLFFYKSLKKRVNDRIIKNLLN